MRRLLPLASSAVIAAAASWAITPASIRLARRLGVVDRPESAQYKRQAAAIPALGGLPFAAGAGLGAATGLLLDRCPPGGRRRAAAALGLGSAAGLIGLADDVRPRPWPLRLAGIAGVAALGWRAGFRCGGLPRIADAAVATLWVTGAANAFNLVDNIDGVATGAAATAGAALAFLADNPPHIAAVGAAIAGAAGGFWSHNRHPAMVYLGDGGALFGGTVLGLIALDVASGSKSPAEHAGAAIVLGLPLFDAAFVLVTRVLRGRSPVEGGRDHPSHRLIAAGVPVPTVARVLVAASTGLGAAGILVVRAGGTTRALTLATVGATAIGAAVFLAALPDDSRPPGTTRDEVA